MPSRTVACLDLHFPSLEAEPGLADRVSLALDDLSPAAIHETGEDHAPVWRVFLADPAQVPGAHAALTSQFSGAGLHVMEVAVEDEDWAARSQAHLTRVPVGRVTVAPPWDATPPESGVMVVIHPSTGFGTGHHQTTRLCLRMLQDLDLAGRRVVDLGTGSGVLALAAWRLGAGDVEALDYDADAIVNALENLRLNDAEGHITMRLADLRVDAVAPADVVTANLTGALLIAQAPAIRALIRPGGTLVVSGILSPEADDVRQAFASGLEAVDEAAEDAWRALRFVSR